MGEVLVWLLELVFELVVGAIDTRDALTRTRQRF